MTDRKPLTVDIFCRVIDNFGDAGVLWRIARELTALGNRVRLVIDDTQTLAPLAGLAPNAPLSAFKENFGIEVCRWEAAWDAGVCPLMPAHFVIEGFACRLPATYEEAMSRMTEHPAWVNVDYFSAEDWIDECHLMPSIHPNLGLKKLFFFPGVSPKSGGLTIEKNYDVHRRAFEATHATKESATQKVLFFGYPYAPLKALAQAFASLSDLTLALTPTQASRELEAALGQEAKSHRIEHLPFVTQEAFDELLWSSDIAFIRGEDSAARAMIAGIPFIWQIYRQEEDAHLVKLDALTEKMKSCFEDEAAFVLWRDFQRDYNQGHVNGQKLALLLAHYDAWKKATETFAKKLKANGSLVHKLLALL